MRPDTRRVLHRALLAMLAAWVVAVGLSFLILYGLKSVVALWK
jgi:hypothetical protein